MPRYISYIYLLNYQQLRGSVRFTSSLSQTDTSPILSYIRWLFTVLLIVLFPADGQRPLQYSCPPHTALDEQQHGKHSKTGLAFLPEFFQTETRRPAHKHMLIICAEMMFDGCPSLLRFTAAHRCVFTSLTEL